MISAIFSHKKKTKKKYFRHQMPATLLRPKLSSSWKNGYDGRVLGYGTDNRMTTASTNELERNEYVTLRIRWRSAGLKIGKYLRSVRSSVCVSVNNINTKSHDNKQMLLFDFSIFPVVVWRVEPHQLRTLLRKCFHTSTHVPYDESSIP